MIKINLLPQRKTKRADRGQQSVALGFAAIGLAGALVFVFVHRPLQAEVDKLKSRNNKIERSNKDIENKTRDFEQREAAFKAAQAQKEAIDRLNQAKASPAWMLQELSKVLTAGQQPTMTAEMAKRLEVDPNRQWQEDWDPKHVWITRFEEKNGRFRLLGGAQSDADMTELALRLQASMFFDFVQPEGGKEASDRESGASYYEFTISGQVRY